TKPGVLPPNTPLSQWRNLRTFNSSVECQRALSGLRSFFEQDTQKEITVWRKQKDDSGVNRALQAAAAQAVAARSICVAADDARLNKNSSERHFYAQKKKNRGASASSRASSEASNQAGQPQTSATSVTPTHVVPDERRQGSAAALQPKSGSQPPSERRSRISAAVPTRSHRHHVPAARVSVVHNTSGNH